MTVTIRQVRWRDQRTRLLAVRFAVFVEEQGVAPELEHDANDRDALHLLAEDPHGEPVATARMLGDGHIGRMAVVRAARGQGIGTRLLLRLLETAGRRGLDSVFLHAQLSARGFYTRLDFVPEGGVFDDAGIEHQTMRRRVGPPTKRTP